MNHTGDGSSLSIDEMSFDNDLLENNDLIDFQDLIDEPGSPVKKDNVHNITKFPIKNSLSYCKPNLKPVDTNMIANELFQVTNNIRRNDKFKMYDTESQNYNHSIFHDMDQEDGFLIGKKLNNEKIDKLVNDLGLKDLDYELDDQFRTRFYKGRFSKHTEPNDDLDLKLDTYLEDKENMMIYDKGQRKPDKSKRGIEESRENILSPYPDPIKSKGKGIQKSNKMYFKSPRRQKTSIPVLKPLNNLANIEIRPDKTERAKNFHVKSDHNTSIPLHRTIFPSKPSIKYHDQTLNIYIVDSSTGLTNDATKFGTELNASNCEDFPLPENVNEIVQIPTNDDANAKHQKMAIIKVFQNQYFRKELNLKSMAGNYTPEPEKGKSPVNSEKKRVQWANELEW